MRRLTIGFLALSFLALATPVRAQETQLAERRAAVKAEPQEVGPALDLGDALHVAGHYPDALAELRRGVALAVKGGASNGVEVGRYLIAHVYMDQHLFREALNACQAIGQTPIAHACAAEAHMSRRRATDALPEAELALKDSPKLYEGLVVQGAAQWLEGSPDEAETAFRAAIAVSPMRADAHLQLGELYLAQGKREEALKEFRAPLGDHGKSHLVSPGEL
ncbi:MAG TPA: tetratricopeptide repeat protein, partial [Polyangiaceae bacterium]